MTPWTIAHQAPLPMGFSKQDNWSELPVPIPGDLLDPGITPRFPVSPALAGGDSQILELLPTRFVALGYLKISLVNRYDQEIYL